MSNPVSSEPHTHEKCQWYHQRPATEGGCPDALQVYKQKVKHLLYEHQNNLAALKIDAEVAVKEAVERCNQQQQGLVEDKARLKQQLRDQVGDTC